MKSLKQILRNRSGEARKKTRFRPVGNSPFRAWPEYMEVLPAKDFEMLPSLSIDEGITINSVTILVKPNFIWYATNQGRIAITEIIFPSGKHWTVKGYLKGDPWK